MHPLAAFYPNISARLETMSRALRVAPTIDVRQTWLRDMPARVLKHQRKPAPAPDPLWTGGFRMRHNRYVRMGAFPAYHVSDGVTTASAEVFGIAPAPMPVLGMPAEDRLQLLVAVDVPRILDLAEPAVQRLLGVSVPEITKVPDWTRTDALLRPLEYELPQAIGELAFQQGLGGLRYPAARATAGVNLVVFTDNLAKLGGAISATNPFTGEMHRLP